MKLSPQAFFTTQKSLLEAEQASEVAETTLLLSAASPSTLARAGLAVPNLTVNSLKTGLGGRTVIELGLDPAYASTNLKAGEKGNASKSEGALPEHGIRTGDIVRVGEMPKGSAKKKEVTELKSKGVEGVVIRVGERAIWVAAGKSDDNANDTDVDDLASERLWVVKLANDVTYKRMYWALTKLLKTPDEGFTTLQRVLLGLSSPSPPDQQRLNDKLDFVNGGLNNSQKEAMRFALASQEVALIHGPPGTGKTSTIVELVLQFLKQDQRVLVCGPSNISVDNIVERLAASSPATSIVRMGHPARLLPSVLNHSLEVLTRTSEAGALVKDIREEIDQKIASTKKTKNGRERKAIWHEVRELRKDFRDREGKCVDTLIGGSAVVLATLHGAGSRQVTAGSLQGKSGFDVIVIDEAGQGLEVGCWVPIVTAAASAKKLVLAGDHLQLPPTVKSSDNHENPRDDAKQRMKALESELQALSIGVAELKAAKRMTLEFTMFDRLLHDHGTEIKRLLNTQYRMHEKIMRFPSDTLYDGELVAAEAVKSRLLKDLEYEVQDTEDTREPLVFYDTQGGDFPEKTEESHTARKSVLLGDSKSNEAEAAIVAKHVLALTEAGVKAEDIAVVTPYNAQLAILQAVLREQYPGLELGSVDGFQGREKEAIIVSLVRSNDQKEVGFLGEKRRLNVAMTRPKRHLCIIGDSETVGHGSSFLKSWMKHLEEHADLRYPTLDDID